MATRTARSLEFVVSRFAFALPSAFNQLSAPRLSCGTRILSAKRCQRSPSVCLGSLEKGGPLAVRPHTPPTTPQREQTCRRKKPQPQHSG
ncbi:unnamed protein product [Mesocestoides corti]|uniref:Secreted protein n=1 Tax=Mesocestoides corti TaxID=53468 RepID=A0A0R3U2Y4_MESCO|nr:unnamed protein product [Mesocestoides corti]